MLRSIALSLSVLVVTIFSTVTPAQAEISEVIAIQPGVEYEIDGQILIVTVEPELGVEVSENAQLSNAEYASGLGLFRYASAPQCIYAYKEWGAIQVQNDCPLGWRVKVILRRASDSTCKYIAPNTRSNIGFNPYAKIDGIEVC